MPRCCASDWRDPGDLERKVHCHGERREAERKRTGMQERKFWKEV